MAEQLQHLIDRIQQEAVEKAEAEAEAILSSAREQAAAIVKESEERAAKQLEQADQDAEQFTERSRKALEQAARDLLITVGQGVEAIITEQVNQAVDEAMTPEVLEKMLLKVAEQQDADDLEVCLNDADRKALSEFFASRFKEAVRGGIEIKTDNEVIKGFTVALKGSNVYQDFTAVAIAESVSRLLRPQLAEIVRKVAIDEK